MQTFKSGFPVQVFEKDTVIASMQTMMTCACIFCIQSIMCRHITHLYKATSSTTGLE